VHSELSSYWGPFSTWHVCNRMNCSCRPLRRISQTPLTDVLESIHVTGSLFRGHYGTLSRRNLRRMQPTAVQGTIVTSKAAVARAQLGLASMRQQVVSHVSGHATTRCNETVGQFHDKHTATSPRAQLQTVVHWMPEQDCQRIEFLQQHILVHLATVRRVATRRHSGRLGSHVADTVDP
jgi:hypothetical protein